MTSKTPTGAEAFALAAEKASTAYNLLREAAALVRNLTDGAPHAQALNVAASHALVAHAGVDAEATVLAEEEALADVDGEA